MGKSRHSEAQIIAALKQVEAGRAVEDVARECGVSKHTIYAWKSKARLGQACLAFARRGDFGRYRPSEGLEPQSQHRCSSGWYLFN
ncbi:MAG TPA: transposase [Bryobacteraceae bacterium]|nr:transposase [Bryobacteraceae bacterium]